MTGDRRFGGIDRLYGLDGAQRIRQAHVVVVGIGGVGSWAVEALARNGVGRLTLIDLDHLAESNINRQIHAVQATLGQAKVLAMQDRIHAYFEQCEVTCIDAFVDTGNWPGLLPGEVDTVDAVIDACDCINAKLAMAAWARQVTTIFVTVGAAGGKRLAHWTDLADLAHVTHDPLLSKLRYRLRKEHAAPNATPHGSTRSPKTIGIQCVFSREPVATPHASCGLVERDQSLNCHGLGSQVGVTASFGLCAASYVLNRLAA